MKWGLVSEKALNFTSPLGYFGCSFCFDAYAGIEVAIFLLISGIFFCAIAPYLLLEKMSNER